MYVTVKGTQIQDSHTSPKYTSGLVHIHTIQIMHDYLMQSTSEVIMLSMNKRIVNFPLLTLSLQKLTKKWDVLIMGNFSVWWAWPPIGTAHIRGPIVCASSI